MKHIEVEQKYRLLSDPAALKAALIERDAEPGRPSHQIDTYYNAPHRDFLAPEHISEWLRVRVEDGTSSLNFKRWHPIEAAVKTHCDEFESTLSDAEAVQKLLDALDFTHLTTVDKVREEWHCQGIAVAFDTVAGLGTFIEFEYKDGDATTVAQATEILDAFIADLGATLGDRIHAGYPHLALGMAPATA